MAKARKPKTAKKAGKKRTSKGSKGRTSSKLSKEAGRPRRKTRALLPVFPTFDMVPIPGLVVPLSPSKTREVEAVNYALANNIPVVLTIQKDLSQRNSKAKQGEESAGQQISDQKPSARTLSRISGVGQIIHSVRLPNGEMKCKVHIQGRARIEEFKSFAPFVKSVVEFLDEPSNISLTPKQLKLFENVKEKLSVLSQFDPGLEEPINVAREIYEPGTLADLTASMLPLEVAEGQKVLETLDPIARLELAHEFLNAQIDSVTIKERISNRAEKELGKMQHQELLREQLRQIREELGEAHDSEEELLDLKKQLERLKMPAHAKKEATRQLQRLQQLHPDTAEAALARTYIDWLFDLPWSKKTRDRLDIKLAKKILDDDHYGLDKTKERILDFLGVRKLKKDLRGPVLLFVGPPGVGKTTLGRSIAKALGREFVRVSVGGLRDEAELRGHRRTYVGAMPGRIIQGLKTAGTKNPVFMLDELDKIGSDFRGDPSSVLLEILDPEQNSNFEDHYLNIAFDLSEVMFIGTANIVDTIPPALLDRLEVIELPGYTGEEKLEIAKRHLILQAINDNGLGGREISLVDPAVYHLIDCYTRESGVRDLGRQLQAVFRKIGRTIAEGGEPPKKVTPKLVEELLGPLRFIPERKSKADEVGVVTGLAWTSVGGEILTIEASVTKGKGALSLTGQLGEVMRESAMAALTYVLSRAESLGIDPRINEESNVHVHIPHGAIPKDGPSAGIAVATALVSIFTKRPVSRDVAMTGEMTLRGNVLQIGGLREKALAAMRVGIPVVIIPKENERELVEFPSYLLEKVKFIPVESIDQVLEFALVEDEKPRWTRTQAKAQIAPVKPTKPNLPL